MTTQILKLPTKKELRSVTTTTSGEEDSKAEVEAKAEVDQDLEIDSGRNSLTNPGKQTAKANNVDLATTQQRREPALQPKSPLVSAKSKVTMNQHALRSAPKPTRTRRTARAPLYVDRLQHQKYTPHPSGNMRRCLRTLLGSPLTASLQGQASTLNTSTHCLYWTQISMEKHMSWDSLTFSFPIAPSGTSSR